MPLCTEQFLCNLVRNDAHLTFRSFVDCSMVCYLFHQHQDSGRHVTLELLANFFIQTTYSMSLACMNVSGLNYRIAICCGMQEVKIINRARKTAKYFLVLHAEEMVFIKQEKL